jgi:DNA-binding CsgD family transcriptional regulator
VEQTAHDLVLAVVRQQAPTGISVVIEGAPGIGKTFLARAILDSVPPDEAKVLTVAGEQGRRKDPFAGARPLLGDLPDGADPAEMAFDRVDELCADGPVVLYVDDAHHLDAATLTLIRRLVWASRSLPLAVLVTTRPDLSREPLTRLIGQTKVRLWLPPMGPMMVERLVHDQTGRWPGPLLRRVLAIAAGNPLFVAELLRAYRNAGALEEAGPDSIEARFELDLRGSGLDEVIRGQLGQLDSPTRDVLAAMAVWGTGIGAGDLARLLAGSDSAVDEPLERAIASGLVRRDPGGLAGFSHDLFREVTYGELSEAERGAMHRRAAEMLAADGYRPSLIADHLLRAAGTDGDTALVTALHDAVAATAGHAPEVTADLLADVPAVRADMPEQLLLDHADALFNRGRGEAAEMLIRERIRTVSDPAIATRMQVILIRSLFNRADVAAALAVIERTAAIAGLSAAAIRMLEGTRAWLLVQAGQGLPAGELDAMMARFVAEGDQDAQAGILATIAFTAFRAGHPEQALEFMRTREKLLADRDSFSNRSSALSLPAMFELAAAGPVAAREALWRARRLAAERQAPWVNPFLGFAAGGIAFAAGDWDDAVAELDAALERAEETGTGWISLPVGFRSYIDAHRGNPGQARDRLESFRHRGLPLQFGHARPGCAELAVLEAEGKAREAGTLARTLWSTAREHPGQWAAELAPDVTRVAMTRMDRRLAAQISEEVSALCSPDVSRLVHAMLDADPDVIEETASRLAGSGRLAAEAFAREELACAAAAAGDRDRAAAALDAALAGYQRMGAVPDRNRALARTRALGIRRGSREPHRDTDFGWESLTATENRVAALVRDGLTNREIGIRLFVSPRTIQTHVSHILQKTGLRSRVKIARFAAT